MIRRRNASNARPARSAAGWHEHAPSSAAHSRGEVSRRPRPEWPLPSHRTGRRIDLAPPLRSDSARTAHQFAGRSTGAGYASTSASALAHCVLHSTIVGRLRFVLATVLALSTIAAGACYFAASPAAQDESLTSVTARVPPASAEPQHHAAEQSHPKARPTDAPSGRITVTGSILDPAGKAMPGVPVDFVGRPRVPYVAAVDKFDAYTLLGQGATGDDGQFHVDITPTSSARFFDVYALAKPPGYGLSWTTFDPDDRHPSAQIRFRPEQPIRTSCWT